MKNFQSSIVIGIMCFLLSFGIAIQISSINNENTVIAKRNEENELRNRVIDLNNDYKNKYKKLEKIQAKLDQLRNSASEKNERSKILSENLNKINISLGLNNVKGKGIIIKIKTGDLLLVLNALNNAGAEAISVNENRITYFSKIKNDGDIVYLNGKVLESPFEIKAIGSDTLYGAITRRFCFTASTSK